MMKYLWSLLCSLLLVSPVLAANDFYNHGSYPATGSAATSAGMRAELDLIGAGFEKLPALAGNGNKAVIVNGGGTALSVTTGTLSLAGNFSISGAFATTITVTAGTTVTLPVTGTLATLAGSETFTTKTFSLANNTLTGTVAQFNTALSDGDFATLAGSETLTTKTVNLASNTLTGTTAQFNTALSDNDFATLAGSETLTTKTINLSSNTLTGTTAQFNTALSDNDFATLAGTENLSNKTLIAPAATGLGAGALTLIQSQTASSSATIDFVTGITSTYDAYVVTLTNIFPATDATDLWVRVSEDGGSTFKAGANDYAHVRVVATPSGGVTGPGNSTDTKIVMAGILSNTNPNTFSGELTFYAPSGSKYKMMSFSASYFSSTPSVATLHGGGNYNGSSNAINAIRFMMSSGNIASGTFTLYGVRKT